MSEAAAQGEANKVSTDTPTVSQSTIDNAAESVAGLEQLGMLDKGSLAKLEAIEKKIFYRRFYFPGGVAEKRMPGLGTDKPGEYKYDQLPGDRYVMDSWDPRYLDDYITQARQNAFHKHFIYFDGVENKPISFEDAYNVLKFSINGGKIDGDNKREAVGIVVGLMYMGKLGLFLKDYASDLQTTSTLLQQSLKNMQDYTRDATSALVGLIRQSCPNILAGKSEFITSDVGWLAEDNKYAFDISKYAAEWQAMQKEYNEYKEKIWNILKNVKNLNLCTNINKGIQVGNVNIQQQMECIQKVTSAAAVDDKPKEEPQAEVPKLPPPAPKPAPAPTPPPPAPEPVAPTPPPAPEPAQPQAMPQPAAPSNNNMMIIIVLVGVVVVLIGIGIAVFVLRDSNDNDYAYVQPVAYP